MDSMLAEISISLDHGPITLNECDDTTYDGWMSNLCDEPIGDAKICCLGFWLPCLLYGKVDERIKLVQQGKNPEDAGNGCGADCLIWQVGCFGFAGALTANRRTRIRGLYDIDGLMKDDCIKSWFCNCCVLMQMDREIRARNGKTSLRTSAEYTRQCSKVIKLQPTPIKSMTYAPGEGADNRTEVENMILCRRPPPARLPKGMPKKIAQSSIGRQHQLREVINASGTDHTIDVVVHCAKAAVPLTYTPVANTRLYNKHKQLPAIRESNKSAQVARLVGDNLPVGTTLTSSKQAPIKPGGMFSFIANVVPGIFKNEKHANTGLSNVTYQETGSKSKQEGQGRRGHALEDCLAVEQVYGTSNLTPKTHTLTECTMVEVSPHGNQASEHSLTDSETIVIAGQRSLNQMSYAHDFTECQVDAEILEYFEQEERRSQEHKLENCSIRSTIPHSSPIVPGPAAENGTFATFEQCADCDTTEDVQEHRISECNEPVQPTSQPVEQHALNDCRILSPILSAVLPELLPSPEIADCCLEDLTSMIELNQHNLDNCTRLNSVAAVNPRSRISSSCAEEAHDNVTDCCDLCTEIKVVKQHRISQCSRSSSMNALHVPKSQEHRLSQCTRSCSMPVLESSTPTEHAIDECNAIVDDQEQTRTHDLDDCLVAHVAEGFSRVETTLQEPESTNKGKEAAVMQDERVSQKPKKFNKGKRRSSKSKSKSEQPQPDSVSKKTTKKRNDVVEDLQNCNIPKHAALESQLSLGNKQNVKALDVVVAVDVVVGGKKVKAQVIPVLDGPKSPRPSQVREASAQQALQNVLASSQRTVSTSTRQAVRQYPYQRYPRGVKNLQQENSEQEDGGESNIVVLGVPGPESAAALEVERAEKSAGQRLLAAVSGLVGAGNNSGSGKE